MAKGAGKTFGYTLLMLFGLPFALIGLGTLYLALAPIVRSAAARSWPSVPAYILEASVRPSSSSEGSDTFRLTARYRYEVAGHRYESDDVSFYAGSDNIDSFHQDRFEELRPFIGSGTPFHAFVNPSDPSEAVLFPVVRWGASAGLGIFGCVFSVAGFGIIIAGLFARRSSAEHTQLATETPGQPWLHRKEWAERRMRCDSKLRVIILGGLTIFWNGISSFVPLAILRDLRAGHLQYPMLIFLIFPAIGLLLLWWWGVSFLRWRRFGNSELTWDANPLMIGGELRGMLSVSRKLLEVAKSLELTILCQEHLTTGSGKNRSTRTTTVAESKAALPLASGMGVDQRSHITIRLPLPSYGHVTTETGNPRYTWKLTAYAAIPGSDFSAEFELPVFQEAVRAEAK